LILIKKTFFSDSLYLEKWEPVTNNFQDKPFQQYRFIAIEENTDDMARLFDVGKQKQY
jgi:hypothetical protein